MDLSYNCTANPLAFRDALAKVGRGSRVFNLAPLSEGEVARLLVAMGASLPHAAGAPGIPPDAPSSAAAGLGPVIDALAAAVKLPPVWAGGALYRGPDSPALLPVGAPSGPGWRPDVVSSILREDHGHLDWARVVACLDFPECSLASHETFRFVVTVVLACNGSLFPTPELVRKPWANVRAQLDGLRHAVQAPPEALSFTFGVTDPSRLLQPVPGSHHGIGSAANHAWCSVDLFATLVRIAGAAHATQAAAAGAGGDRPAVPPAALAVAADAERAVGALLEQAERSVPELVLLGMARCKVDDGVDSDPTGADPNPVRSRLYNTLLTSAFGPLLAASQRSPPGILQASLLARLWETSRALAASSLLALVRGIANRAGGDHEQLRTSLEGVARVVGLTLHLPDFASVLLSAPAPQLAVEVAVYLSTPGPDVEARVAAEPLPAAWTGGRDGEGPAGATPASTAGGGASSTGLGFKLDAWLTACLTGGVGAPPSVGGGPGSGDRMAAAAVAFLKRVAASQAQVLQACRMRTGAPPDGSGASATPPSASPTAGEPSAPPPPASPAAAAEAAAQESAAKEALVRPDLLALLFRVLKAHGGSLSPPTTAALQAVFEGCCRVFPSLNASVSSHEVEEQANAYFQRIYTSQQSMAEVVEMLQRFRASPEPREREIFSCMIHNLFDEYRFFHKYPEKELRITGVLFGQLIAHQLVASSTLGIALRYVLEALRKPPTSLPAAKMYRFGMYALEQFKGRLPKWPQYCAHVVAIPHLRVQYPDFVAEVEAALAASTGGVAPTPGGGPSPGGAPGIGASLGGSLGATVSLVSGPGMEGADGLGGAAGSGGADAAAVAAAAAAAAAASDAAASAAAAAAAAPPSGSPPGGAPAAPTSAAPAPSSASSGLPPRLALQADIRARIAALGADLTVALGAAAAGQPIPAVLPSAAAAAAAAKEAEEERSGGAGGGTPLPGADGAATPSAAAAAAAAAGGVVDGLALAAGGAPSLRIIDAPPPNIGDRYNFIVNNLTDANLEPKVSETLSFARPEHYPWLGAFLVKRVATQPNFQLLYRAFLDRLGQRGLDSEVTRSTLDNIRRLLMSDRIRADARERTTLKNLGSWLGKITLGRGRPLLFKDVNVRELLHEAYESGRLIACVPFVAKVLEAASDSRVFRPPNPWTIGVLSSLRELYDVPDLKLNLKFEVEVLCKALAVEVKDVRPARYLPLRARPALSGNPDFNPKAALHPETVPGIPTNKGGAGGPGASAAGGGADGAGGAAGADAGATGASLTVAMGAVALPGLASLVTVKSFAPALNPGTAPPAIPEGTPVDAAGAAAAAAGEDPGADRDEPGSARANLRHAVAVAVDRAVRDLLQPVVERSVTIAAITARELLTKDYALEPDAARLVAASHAFAGDLAGSLALVTCLEPLKASIGVNLRTLLTSHPSVITGLPVPLASLGEPAVNAMLAGVVAENLEPSCLLIERAAMDRATKVIDEALAAAVGARRKAAEGGGAFVDASAYSSGARWPAVLPEVLRPLARQPHGSGAPGGGGLVPGLSPGQHGVYATFREARLAAMAAAGAAATAAAAAASSQASAAAAAPAAAPTATPTPGGAAGGGAGLLPQTSAAAAAALAAAPAGAVAAFTQAGGEAGGHPGAPAAAPAPVPSAAAAAQSLVGSAALLPALSPALTPGQGIAEFNGLLERLTAAIRSTAAAILAANPSAGAGAVTGATLSALPGDHELISVLRDVRMTGLRLSPGAHREEVCLVQAQKLFRGLYELPSPPHSVLDALALQVYQAGLVVLRDLTQKLRRDLVSYLGYIADDRRFGSDGVLLGLLRSGLLFAPDLDALLAKAMDGGRHAGALRFVMVVLQRAVIAERLLAPQELSTTLDVLVQIAARSQGTVAAPGAPVAPSPVVGQLLAQLPPLLEAVREKAAAAAAAAARPVGAAAPSSGLPAGASSASASAAGSAPAAGGPSSVASLIESGGQAVPPADPAYRQQVLYMLETWVSVCNQTAAAAAAGGASAPPPDAATSKAYQTYLLLLAQHNLLGSDASTERFLRTLMELCVQSCAATSKQHPAPVPPPSVSGWGQQTGAQGANGEGWPPALSFPTPTPRLRLMYTGVDALSKLVVLLVRVAATSGASSAPGADASAPGGGSGATAAKVAFLQKVLAIITRALLRDADANGGGVTPDAVTGGPAVLPPDGSLRFDGRPYLRLFSNLLRDLHVTPPPPPGAAAAAAASAGGAVPAGPTPEETAAAAAAAAEALSFNASVVASFANVLHAVRPERLPGFAFAWLELLPHRLFLPPLMAVPGQRGWPLLVRLLQDLLRFLYHPLRRAEMPDSVKLAYRGALRVFLLLLHDYPEFTADAAHTLVDALPPSTIQLRNLLLAAVPKAVAVPDPFTGMGPLGPGGAPIMASVPTCAVPPRVLGGPVPGPDGSVALPPVLAAALAATPGAAEALEAYLRSPARPAGPPPAGLLGALRASLAAGPEEAAVCLSRYSTPAMHALGLHLATATCARLAAETAAAAAASGGAGGIPGYATLPPALRAVLVPPAALAAAGSPGSPAFELLKSLLLLDGASPLPGAPAGSAPPPPLDAEGRYGVLNGLANLLRYPNAHTLWASRVLIGLFAALPGGPDAPQQGASPSSSAAASAALGALGEAVREQVTRVLLERLIVHRPHPWGLLLSFMELLKAPALAFWAHPFTRLNDDVVKLFESVNKSCSPPPPQAAAAAVAAAAAGGAPEAVGASAGGGGGE